MKIWIITMEDPAYTVDFIKEIIAAKPDEVIGLTIAKGGRMKIGKEKSKLQYALSLLLIMGLPYSVQLAYRKIRYKIVRKLFPESRETLAGFARGHGVIVDYVDNPNSKKYLEKLAVHELDLIINQSQHILKKRLLNTPKIGVLNRHNALLPRNRGRLTPFWVLYKKEKETGVSIHFVTEDIDGGDIVVQKRFEIEAGDSFSRVVNKNYSLAGKAMIEAIELVGSGEYETMVNDKGEGSYNTTPTLGEAWEYRKRDLWGVFRM